MPERVFGQLNCMELSDLIKKTGWVIKTAWVPDIDSENYLYHCLSQLIFDSTMSNDEKEDYVKKINSTNLALLKEIDVPFKNKVIKLVDEYINSSGVASTTFHYLQVDYTDGDPKQFIDYLIKLEANGFVKKGDGLIKETPYGLINLKKQVVRSQASWADPTIFRSYLAKRDYEYKRELVFTFPEIFPVSELKKYLTLLAEPEKKPWLFLNLLYKIKFS